MGEGGGEWGGTGGNGGEHGVFLLDVAKHCVNSNMTFEEESTFELEILLNILHLHVESNKEFTEGQTRDRLLNGGTD